jgi:AcrR family transcriptional regulator
MTSTTALAHVGGANGSDEGVPAARFVRRNASPPIAGIPAPGPSGREQWLRAGQALLRLGGIRAVKLHALSNEAGLTTGSFYHHFAGMTEFLEELARFYGGGLLPGSPDEVLALSPAERIRLASHLHDDAAAVPLHAAMRDWAGSDPVAAEAVRAADEQLLQFMEQAFLDLGHSEAAARTRALVVFSLGVARVHTPWPAPTDLHDRVLDLVAPAD